MSDEYVLYTKTKNAHWNVEGTDFIEKHHFFESQSNQLDMIIDRVAERIRAIGHYANASLKSFLELTHLSELQLDNTSSQSFLKELLSDHDTIIIQLRENIHLFGKDNNDFGTTDFMTSIMEKHEKMAWIIRSNFKA